MTIQYFRTYFVRYDFKYFNVNNPHFVKVNVSNRFLANCTRIEQTLNVVTEFKLIVTKGIFFIKTNKNCIKSMFITSNVIMIILEDIFRNVNDFNFQFYKPILDTFYPEACMNYQIIQYS